MTMLVEYDTFSEDVTRFYITERDFAIEVVRDNLCFIHRWVQVGRDHQPRPLRLARHPVYRQGSVASVGIAFPCPPTFAHSGIPRSRGH